MVFSSSLFLLYFLPVFLILYHIIPVRFRNYFILFSSICFYAWGAPKLVFLVLVSLVVNYYLVEILYKSTSLKAKKVFLILSVGINIAMLGYYKYANFFIENINSVLLNSGIKNIQWTKVLLPIGISFFTFQSLTYTIDIYRNVRRPLNKLTDYMMYIMMFPQLIAGPIIRFNSIADQIVDRREYENIDNKLYGFIRFSIGLGKKVLLANSLGKFADEVFIMNIDQVNSTFAWLGALAYSFQIYYDFSGYSDMAIGIGRMIGFTFPENFNVPYISKNITEFWRRWHITLSTWMKDYLYIPLGGNRVKTKLRLYSNLWIVFLISGFWHGANWTFIIWGAYHGFFLILDKIFYKKISDRLNGVAIFINFIVVLIGWVIFRSENMEYAIKFIFKMFEFNFTSNSISLSKEFWISVITGISFAILPAFKIGQHILNSVFDNKYGIRKFIIMSILSFILLILSIGSITSSGFNPFIYFRF